MVTVTKTYSNLKAAHRQWRHEGHCHYVHGENWTFKITFAAMRLDDKKFVVDFGGLRPLKAKIEQAFDHVLLIDEDDPERDKFEELHALNLTDVRFVPSASAEGLAEFVFVMADQCVNELTDGRVWVSQVVAEEDSKNTATYCRATPIPPQ